MILEYFVHVYMRTDGLCGTVTCDAEYPQRVAYSILRSLLDDFASQVCLVLSHLRAQPVVESIDDVLCGVVGPRLAR